MKLYSWNVNGIRAAHRKGFLTWLKKTKPDILCLQEIKAQEKDFSDKLLNVPGYHLYISAAKKRGYSGTAIYTKQKPQKVIKKIGVKEYDDEGRFLLLQFPKFTIFNTYFPHSRRDLERLEFKMKFNDKYFKFISKITAPNLVLTGDFNVAHKAIDLANPKQNEKNPGFTIQERLFADKLIDNGYIDTFRYLHPKKVQYTWWTFRANARARNIGWRIDYFFTNQNLKNKILKAGIHDKVMGSDHCPASLELKI